MGSLNSTYNNTYNKYVNPYQPFGPHSTGPFIHPSVNDFKKDVEDVYKNRSLIQNQYNIIINILIFINFLILSSLF